MVEVELRRHSACSHCGQCSHGNESQPARFEVSNPVHAEVGDTVLLEMETGSLMKAVMLIYVLPLANLVIGFIFGNWLNDRWQVLPGETFPALLGVGLLALTFVFVRFYDQRMGLNSRFHPQIKRVISE
jgi:sigma-E factor negative regulatory protein RseC